MYRGTFSTFAARRNEQKKEMSDQSLLSEKQIEYEAASDMRASAAKVFQDDAVSAAAVFQGISQNRQPIGFK